MTKKVNILTVSLIAMMAVTSARADIASTTYVNDKIQPVAEDLAEHVADTTMHVTTAEKTAWNGKEDAGNKETALSGYAADSDTKYPTMHVVSTMITDRQADINNSITSLTNGLNAKQDKSASNVSGTLRTGTYLTAGNGVAANLKALDTAIGAEETRAKAAEKAIDDKIGTPTAGKTIVQMISDAQTAATYDDTALAGRVTANETAINTLNGNASTAGSVAKSIADAITDLDLANTYQAKGDYATAEQGTKADNALPAATYNSQVGTVNATNMGTTATTVVGAIKELKTAITTAGTTASNTYQVKSTKDYMIGNKDGGWTEMTAAEQNALKSGITSDKVSTYDSVASAVNNATTGLAATRTQANKGVTDAAAAQATANAALPAATYNSQVGTVSAANMGTTATTVVGAIKEVHDSVAGLNNTYATDTELSNGLALKQDKSDSTATKGNYIAAGTGVGANLGALDTQLKTTTDTANAAIPKPSGTCTDCVLHFNGTKYSWEEVGR